MADEEVTAAAFLTPYRRREADRFIGMFLRAPAWAVVLQQIQLYYFAATTGTDH